MFGVTIYSITNLLFCCALWYSSKASQKCLPRSWKSDVLKCLGISTLLKERILSLGTASKPRHQLTRGSSSFGWLLVSYTTTSIQNHCSTPGWVLKSPLTFCQSQDFDKSKSELRYTSSLKLKMKRSHCVYHMLLVIFKQFYILWRYDSVHATYTGLFTTIKTWFHLRMDVTICGKIYKSARKMLSKDWRALQKGFSPPLPFSKWDKVYMHLSHYSVLWIS